MIKKGSIILLILLIQSCSFAFDNSDVVKEQNVQRKINHIGVTILNANKIDKRIAFAYDKSEKKTKLDIDKSLISRQIIIYESDYKFTENDDEIAAFLARKIATTAKSYDGLWNGRLSSVQIKAAPKKYEIVEDKIAVDYMVNAGYNPIGLILYVNKAFPQKRTWWFSRTNTTSKRLAIIYEYIYTKYPHFLAKNVYFDNINYQNFLLTSQNNRRMLKEKIISGSKAELDYE